MVLGLMSTLTFSVKAWSQSRAANTAVNNVASGPTIQQNVASLVESIARLEKAQDAFEAKGWSHGLDESINTAPRLSAVIAGQASDHQRIMAKLVAMDQAIAAHVEWEETVKHATDENG